MTLDDKNDMPPEEDDKREHDAGDTPEPGGSAAGSPDSGDSDSDSDEQSANRNDRQAGEEPVGGAGPNTLFHDLYGDLKRLAAHFMNRQSPNHTLDPTELLSKAYLKLAERDRGRWSSKGHFMAEAAKTMRSILVDHARAKRRDKRKARGRRIALDGLMDEGAGRNVDILAYDEALKELEAQSKRGAEMALITDLIVIAGMRIEEIAAVLAMAPRTVERRWKDARALLRMRLSGDEE